MLDVKRLLKLLMLATSDNDHEALVAFRKATALLASHDMTWSDLVTAPPEKKRQTPQDLVRQQLNDLLELAQEHLLSESTETFVRSIANQFAKRGYLSPKQRTALESIHQANF